jgi:hypothetical protein
MGHLKQWDGNCEYVRGKERRDCNALRIQFARTKQEEEISARKAGLRPRNSQVDPSQLQTVRFVGWRNLIAPGGLQVNSKRQM